MFELRVNYPSPEEERRIVAATTADEPVEIRPVLTAEDVLALQHLVRRIAVTEALVGAAVGLVRRTRPNDPSAPPFIKEYISWGAGPRASQYLVLGAKARAAGSRPSWARPSGRPGTQRAAPRVSVVRCARSPGPAARG